MIVNVYRYDSGFANVMDELTITPLKNGRNDPVCIDTIPIILPDGYTLGEIQCGDPAIFDEEGEACELCLNNRRGTAILAVSATRIIGLKRAPADRKVTPLLDARIAANLTQQQLADISGVNRRQIQRVETGEAQAGNLTAKNLLALADAMGVDPRDLVGETTEDEEKVGD